MLEFPLPTREGVRGWAPYGKNAVVNALVGSKGLASSFCPVMKAPKFCQTAGF